MVTTARKTDGPAITADIYGTVLTFTFADGAEIVIDASALSPEVQRDAMMHGLKQKIGDAAAMSRNPDTGHSATIVDKRNAMREVRDRLVSGQWNKTRDGASGGSGGLLFRALCEYKASTPPEQLRAWLQGKDKAEQAKLRKIPAIAAIIERMRAADAKAGNVDEDALFAGLGD